MSQPNFKSYSGFITEPFNKELKAATLFMSANLKVLKQYLSHHRSRGGIALITGDVGSDKILLSGTLSTRWIKPIMMSFILKPPPSG